MISYDRSSHVVSNGETDYNGEDGGYAQKYLNPHYRNTGFATEFPQGFRDKALHEFSKQSQMGLYGHMDGYDNKSDFTKRTLSTDIGSNGNFQQKGFSGHAGPVDSNAITTDSMLRRNRTCVENSNTFQPMGLFGRNIEMSEKEKENVPPLPRGFMRASIYPHNEDVYNVPENGIRGNELSRFPERTDIKHERSHSEPTFFKKGQMGIFQEKEDISEYDPQAQRYSDRDGRQLKANRKPFQEITNSNQHENKFLQENNVFGNAQYGESKLQDSRSVTDHSTRLSSAPPGFDRDTSSSYLPLVPYRTHRQETHDAYDLEEERDKRRQSQQNSKPSREEDDGSERGSKKSSKRSSRPRKDRGSDSDESGTHRSGSTHTSRDKRDSTPTLYSLLQSMDCPPNYLEALTTMKQMLKRSDLTEVLPPRFESEKGRRRQVRYGEYFPEKFTGRASKLKRYLQRLLQYSAQVANDDQTRADIIADGVGLSEACLTQLEYAAKVPLPGFSETYDDATISQKKRTLDILLTYVFLFHQEEPNAAVNDLRLEGAMLTGLLDLYHYLHKGSVTLPAKIIEDYLTRGILRASNGQGISLIGNFQSQLRLHKRLTPGWDKDDVKYRSLLFDCCSELAQEAKSVPIPSTIPNGMSQTLLKGGGRRENRTEHNVNEVQVHWDDELELYEEYAAMAMSSTRQDGRPRFNEDRRPRDRDQSRDRNRTRDRYDNKGNGDQKESRENYVIRVFCTAPCACCGSDNHAMLSPIKTPEGVPLNSEYICPVAMCENWEEARQLKPPKLRFAPCPKKFAAINKHDTNLVHAAINDYVEKGSGKFRDQTERLTFKNEVLSLCKTQLKSGGGGTRVVGSILKEERCNSGQVEVISERHGEQMKSVAGTRRETESSQGTKLRSVIKEERCNSTHVEINEQSLSEEMHTSVDEVREGCVIIETYNAHGVTKAPSPLTHSSLHLIVASRVEPSSKQEIRSFLEKNFEKTILRRFEDEEENDGTGCWVLMEMTYGAEYVVPYKVVHGRILADTGSTTTLINEDFARKRGLDIRSTGAGEILLRDVNDGTSKLTKQCFLRLTVTTVEGELISFTVLAFCTDKLKHDILLGTRDLERYKIDVSSHRGEAKMELRDGAVAFPMLDSTQITHLQHLALGSDVEEC